MARLLVYGRTTASTRAFEQCVDREVRARYRILTLSGSTLTHVIMAPSGTRFGGWNFNAASDVIRGIADFDGDGKDDIVITSDWGLGVLTAGRGDRQDRGPRPLPPGRLAGPVAARRDPRAAVTAPEIVDGRGRAPGAACPMT